MHLFIQTTHIRQVNINITIIRSRVNQNRNNLITNLTIHLDNRRLVICMYVIQHCIDPWNTLLNISHCLCLLSIVYLRSTTLMLWTISPTIIFSTSPTLYRLQTYILVLLLKLKSLSSVRCIELIIWRCILFITYILRYFSHIIPFSFFRCITFPFWLSLRSVLQLFIKML